MIDRAALVAAIRSSPLVGRGTCSSIDECMDDADLVERYGSHATVAEALAAAVETEDHFIERQLDCRFGDDDDAELAIAREWEARKAEHAT